MQSHWPHMLVHVWHTFRKTYKVIMLWKWFLSKILALNFQKFQYTMLGRTTHVKYLVCVVQMEPSLKRDNVLMYLVARKSTRNTAEGLMKCTTPVNWYLVIVSNISFSVWMSRFEFQTYYNPKHKPTSSVCHLGMIIWSEITCSF